MEKIKTLLKDFRVKLKHIKNIELIVALLIIAAVLLVYSAVRGKSKIDSSSSSLSTEERLEKVLSSIEGAGEVKVFIYYGNETTVQTSLFDSVSSGSSKDVKGVVVVAEGGGDIGVMLKLAGACSTALDVEPDKVEIYKMKG